MNLFLGAKRIKFVNGGDIEKIVSYAMAGIQKKKAEPCRITVAEWLSALREVIQNPAVSTYGSSGANLDSIAACYVRLIRGAFSPASDPLINRDAYNSDWDNERKMIVCTYKPDEETLDALAPYDRALHDAIASRFERIATQIENNTLYRLCL